MVGVNKAVVISTDYLYNFIRVPRVKYYMYSLDKYF